MAEQEILGSIPGSEKVLLGFIKKFSVSVTESGFVPGWWQVAPITWDLKKHNWKNVGVFLGILLTKFACSKIEVSYEIHVLVKLLHCAQESVLELGRVTVQLQDKALRLKQ